jgi:hypothetical protein
MNSRADSFTAGLPGRRVVSAPLDVAFAFINSNEYRKRFGN